MGVEGIGGGTSSREKEDLLIKLAVCVAEVGVSIDGCFLLCSRREPDRPLLIASPFWGSDEALLAGERKDPLEARCRRGGFGDRLVFLRVICVEGESGEESSEPSLYDIEFSASASDVSIGGRECLRVDLAYDVFKE